ncbi:TIGR00730 family Rossman fold protein [Sphingobacterium sp. Mn56C]|uniref:LOG family protein n=1 Tax=Sphingobacterium sp. Mn56C TaxID=3395261 RepID=UPI003BD512F1
MKLKSIAVFCASSEGNDRVYVTAAKQVGAFFAQNNIRLIYGGGNVGLMGAVADAVMENQGTVIGVIPYFLSDKEVGHTGITELINVDSMHQRKQKMSDLAEGFIALPGGFGTLEELFEIITWAQLGLHNKPVGILNTNGFYTTLIAFIDQMVESGLLKKENRAMLLVADTLDELLSMMESYIPVYVPKWIEK